MPSRSTSRRTSRPFVSLPRHRRRSLVIRLQGRMLRNAHYTGSTAFDSHQLLIDPEEPDRLHTWVDIVFPGLDRFTLWNAELITTQMAKLDLASNHAYEQISAQLAAANETYETRYTTHLIPRKHPGEQRMYRMEFAPEKHYDCLQGLTFSQARETLEESLMQSLPTPPERFEIDRSYAYGIGLHAVVNAANLDTAVIEQTIARFRALGEKNWVAEP
jgi:hypothetical protein